MSPPLETSSASLAPVSWQRWIVVAAVASLIAAVTGSVAIVILIPILLLPPFLPVALLIGTAYGSLLALPVTLLLLPLTALALERLNMSRMIFLPPVGLVGGALVIALVFTEGRYGIADANYREFFAAGALGGLAAGLTFVCSWRKAP